MVCFRNSLLGTACIDTTCTIWDVTTQQAKTQIIAHDKEVYDISESMHLLLTLMRLRVPSALRHRSYLACYRQHHYRIGSEDGLVGVLSCGSFRTWQGPVRLGGGRRVSADVRPSEPRALDHHLRGKSHTGDRRPCGRSRTGAEHLGGRGRGGGPWGEEVLTQLAKEERTQTLAQINR